MENPSLNLHLLCLDPKYLDLIFVGFVLWAILEVWMCIERASNQHGLWSFLWDLAFVFLRVSAISWASSYHAPK